MDKYERRSLFDKYKSMVKTGRATPLTEYKGDILEGLKGELRGALPLPEDITNLAQLAVQMADPRRVGFDLPIDIAKGIVQGAVEHPITTAVTMAGPEAGLIAAREALPFAARTYLHNFIPSSPDMNYISNKQLKNLLDDAYTKNTKYSRSLMDDINNGSATNVYNKVAHKFKSRTLDKIQYVTQSNPALGKFFIEREKEIPDIKSMFDEEFDFDSPTSNKFDEYLEDRAKQLENNDIKKIVDEYKWYPEIYEPDGELGWNVKENINPKELAKKFVIEAKASATAIKKNPKIARKVIKELALMNEPFLAHVQKNRPGYIVDIDMSNPQRMNLIDQLMFTKGILDQASKEKKRKK